MIKLKEITNKLVQDKIYRMIVLVRGTYVLWGGLFINMWMEDLNPDALFRVYLPVACLYFAFVYVSETLIKSIKLNNSCKEILDEIINKLGELD